MYLLNTRTKRLSSFFDEQRPTYAILSHTWGAEEVTYQDLHDFHQCASVREESSSPLSSRAGWRKIQACCGQASIDGFEWVWIDTCCIDKSSSAELSEAINSMFAWYRGSKLCYAFLEDVIDATEDIAATDSCFRRSRWFTRGWTLQELLAPRRIRFFNSSWQVMGQLDKGSKLTEVVSEITSIPSAFLEGLNLQKANIAMRMSWASKRVTTRKEDLAYCLLGIFDINMPLLYGEGMKAFRRLQEEILQRTYDHSLIAWGLLPWDEGYSLSSTEPCGILATSPSDFANCGSLNICSRSARSNFRMEYQMSNEGLRIQLPLKHPRFSMYKESNYNAVLDCFSRYSPSRKIAIPLQKALKYYGRRQVSRGRRYLHAEDDDIFMRTGRSLLLSDIHPCTWLYGPRYIFKTIHIAVDKNPAILSRYHYEARIDFPRHYRCDVKYVHPWYKVDKDPFTTEDLSLRLRRRAWYEASDWYANSPRVSYFVQKWDQYRNVFANILSGRLPYARVRMRLDSIKLCVKVTKEEQGPTSAHPPSFMVLIGDLDNIPHDYADFPDIYSVDMYCRLAPLPEPPSQHQTVHPSGLSHDMVGYRSLEISNETLEVCVLCVPDNLYNQSQSVLFKIDVKTDESPRIKSLDLQRLLFFVLHATWQAKEYRFLLSVLWCYGSAVCAIAVSGSRDWLSLYLAMWTFCFMPMVYEIRRNPFEDYQNTGPYERIIPHLLVLLIGVGISLYPAIQQIRVWPSTSSHAHNSTIQ